MSELQRLDYNFHGLLTLRIECCSEVQYLECFDAIANFKSEVDSPDVCVRIVHEVVCPRSCVSVTHAARVSKNVIYQTGRIKNFRFACSYEWNGDDSLSCNGVALDVAAHLSGPVGSIRLFATIQTVCILPLIEFELLKRGIASVHCTALSAEHKASLIVGRGGVFKTSIAMELDRGYGFECLGDDKVLVNRQGLVFSYKTFPYLYSYRKHFSKDEFLSGYDKFNFLRKHRQLKRLGLDRPEQLPLEHIVALERGSGDIENQRITSEQMRTRLLCNYQIEKRSSQGFGAISKSILYDGLLKQNYIYPDLVYPHLDGLYSKIIEGCTREGQYISVIGSENFSSSLVEHMYFLLTREHNDKIL